MLPSEGGMGLGRGVEVEGVPQEDERVCNASFVSQLHSKMDQHVAEIHKAYDAQLRSYGHITSNNKK